MDQKEQRLSEPNSTSERQRRFSTLRNQTLMDMHKAIEKRRKENPTPTEQEIIIGAFLEEIEPQVRSAVLNLNDKGYTTDSSGFYGDKQGIDGSFIIDRETKKKLEEIGVVVDERNNGYIWIMFTPENPDIDEIKRKWDKIADIVPSKGKPTSPSMTHGSILFREKYGHPIIVERILLESTMNSGRYHPDYIDRKLMERRVVELKKKEISLDKDIVAEKQKKWIEVTEMVDRLRDGLGKPVDRGIKKSVIAINAIGFETRQSCEGHLDWGHAYPWVDIKTKNYVGLGKQISEIFDQADRAEQEGKSHEDVDALFRKAHDLRKEMERPVLEEAKRFSVYLDEFYQERQVPHDIILVLRPSGSTFILESQGSYLQDIAGPVEKKRKLFDFRREMNEFAAFLKNKFFQSN